jgi:hypothetical protein
MRKKSRIKEQKRPALERTQRKNKKQERKEKERQRPRGQLGETDRWAKKDEGPGGHWYMICCLGA